MKRVDRNFHEVNRAAMMLQTFTGMILIARVVLVEATVNEKAIITLTAVLLIVTANKVRLFAIKNYKKKKKRKSNKWKSYVDRRHVK